MKKEKIHITNAVRILEKAGAKFEIIDLGIMEAKSGIEVAELLKEDVSLVYKTIVTIGKSKEHYVFMVPAEEKLNLKKGAVFVGEKSIEPIKQKELLPLTGYVHGGCSPVGMKKRFRTVIHEDSLKSEYIFFSAGKIGQQIKTSVSELEKAIELEKCELV